MYAIEFTAEAASNIDGFERIDQKRIIDHIEQQLRAAPNVPTRNRKQLRANPLARWEMKLDRFRIFYDIDEATSRATVIAIGE